MDVFIQREREVKDTGVVITVPNNDLARLMYYLRSVTTSCGIDVLPARLVDFQRWARLTSTEADEVYRQAWVLSPDELLEKVIHHDAENKLCGHGRGNNQFLELHEATSMLTLTGSALVGGTTREVTKVLIFNTAWLTRNYIEPLRRAERRLNRLGARLILHCCHCAGGVGRCACTSCPRREWSDCRPTTLASLSSLVDRLAGVSVSATAGPRHCAHCPGRAAKCGCGVCPRPAGTQCVDHCDHCWGVEGACDCKSGCPRLATTVCTPLVVSNHCTHCKGLPGGKCACSVCPRRGATRCVDHCDHCWGLDGACDCKAGCPPLATSRCARPRVPPKAVAPAPPPPSRGGAPAALRAGQRVVLSGLRSAGMNGKAAVVVDPFAGNGRVEVEVVGEGTRFNVLVSNLRAAPANLD